MNWWRRILPWGTPARPDDSSKAQSVVAEIKEMQDRIRLAASVDGVPHYDLWGQVKQFETEGDINAAIELLLRMADAAEKEAEAYDAEFQDTVGTSGVAPAPFERLAILYRKQKNYAEEVKVLQRFASLPHAPGVKPEKLLERLIKARKLAAKQSI